MRAPRLRIAAHESLVAGLDEENDDAEVLPSPQTEERDRERIEEVRIAHVENRGRGAGPAGGAGTRGGEVRERGQQCGGQVVHAQVPEILERADGLGLARAGKPRPVTTTNGVGVA